MRFCKRVNLLAALLALEPYIIILRVSNSSHSSGCALL